MDLEERKQCDGEGANARGLVWSDDGDDSCPIAREKRIRTPGSSGKKMAAPCKRMREDEYDVMMEEEDFNIASLLDSDGGEEEGAGGDKVDVLVDVSVPGAGDDGATAASEISRSGVAEGDGGGRWVVREPERKRLRTRSNFLVVLKGARFKNLTMQEHRELIGNIDDQVFSGKCEREPRIDWTSWKEKSMVGCEDQYTVCWLKGIVPKLMLGCTAWKKDETPFERKYVTMVPMPMGRRPAEDIMKRVVEANDLKGDFGIMGVSRKENHVTILVGVDGVLGDGLEARGCQAHCGVVKLRFERAERNAVLPWREKGCYGCGDEGHQMRNCTR